jgi:hypothetical protein
VPLASCTYEVNSPAIDSVVVAVAPPSRVSAID